MSTLDRDDAMLDGLGLGGRAPSDDPLAGMLAAWRDDLTEAPYAPTRELDLAAITADLDLAAITADLDLDHDLPSDGTVGLPDAAHLPDAFGMPDAFDLAHPAGQSHPAGQAHSIAPGAGAGPTAPAHGSVLRPAAASGPAGPRADSSRRPGRRGGSRPARGGRVRPGRLIAAAVLLVAVLGGGVTVGSATGRPGSALWPVTRLVYAERADSRVAARDVADLLARADRALAERRHDDAELLLRQAWARLPQVRERADHERLRAELTRLVDALLAATATPSAAPAPTPSAGAGPAPTPGRSTPAATPSPTTAPGGLLPGLPPLLPSLPPILPSLLPDLPLL